jgi:hypothetical protein
MPGRRRSLSMERAALDGTDAERELLLIASRALDEAIANLAPASSIAMLIARVHALTRSKPAREADGIDRAIAEILSTD